MKKLLVIVAVLPIFLNAQTAEEKKRIASFSDKNANAVLQQELRTNEQQRVARLDQYLKNHPEISPRNISPDGQITELIDVLPNGEKIFARTDNAGAAITARANRLYNGGALGINIQGQGMTAGVWDGGKIRKTHQEFMIGGVSKVNTKDVAVVNSNHATHVAGTISAQGINVNAKGVAFNASINGYDWTNDLTEMIGEATEGLLVSNHSYGMGQLSSIWFYGAYDNRAKQIDEIVYNNPYYLPCIAAGNERNNTTEDPSKTQIANKGGYDLIFGHGNAKNALTVAAVNQVNDYFGPASVSMSQFSSYGPSDDGRIKPEISMKGVSVFSSIATNDTAYDTYQGTSMATPGVTGVVTLLQQYNNQLYNSYMKAATVKGLILHTADEAGLTMGPDYRFGWGLINAENAAKAIRDKNLINNRSIIEENSLANGGVYTKTIVANGSTSLKISISWSDPAYPTANTGATDPVTIYLVNDLDVKVTDSNGVVYYPWKLQGMANPNLAATNTSTNDVDVFERIDIPNPSGVYTITVNHKGSLINNNQAFSLIATGENVSLGVNENKKNENQISIYPNPAKDYIYFKNNNLVEAIVSIVDMAGRIVSKENVKDGRMNVQTLETGEYVAIYKDKKRREVSLKFIKK